MGKSPLQAINQPFEGLSVLCFDACRMPETVDMLGALRTRHDACPLVHGEQTKITVGLALILGNGGLAHICLS